MESSKAKAIEVVLSAILQSVDQNTVRPAIEKAIKGGIKSLEDKSPKSDSELQALGELRELAQRIGVK
ncbi:MAG: hypothetical protein ABIK25_19470 [Pseudomonadota bacterium]